MLMKHMEEFYREAVTIAPNSGISRERIAA